MVHCVIAHNLHISMASGVPINASQPNVLLLTYKTCLLTAQRLYDGESVQLNVVPDSCLSSRCAHRPELPKGSGIVRHIRAAQAATRASLRYQDLGCRNRCFNLKCHHVGVAIELARKYIEPPQRQHSTPTRDLLEQDL